MLKPGIMRKIFLVCFLCTIIPATIISWIAYRQDDQMFIPAVLFSVLWVLFLAGEVWGKLTGDRHTISTRITKWVEKHPVLGFTYLILFGLAFIFLTLHFGWIG